MRVYTYRWTQVKMDFLYRSVTPALRRGSASRDCRWCGKAKQNLRSFPTCPSRFSCRHSQRPVLVTMHLDGSMHIKWIIGTVYNSNVLHFPTLLGCKLLGKVPMIFFFHEKLARTVMVICVPKYCDSYSCIPATARSQGEPGLQCVVGSLSVSIMSSPPWKFCSL